MVCGDKGGMHVFDDGQILLDKSLRAFELEPSTDEVDFFILACSQAMQLHISGIKLVEACDHVGRIKFGEKSTHGVYEHLQKLSVDDWARIRARIDWYERDNARIAAFDTTVQGESS